MAAIVRRSLEIYRPEELTSVKDLFRCLPFECTLMAGVCARRQQEAVRPKTLPGDAARFGTREHLKKCVDCNLGRKVVEAVGPAPDRKPEQLSAVSRRRAQRPKTREFTIDDLAEVVARAARAAGADAVIEAIADAVWPVTTWAREERKVA